MCAEPSELGSDCVVWKGLNPSLNLKLTVASKPSLNPRTALNTCSSLQISFVLLDYWSDNSCRHPLQCTCPTQVQADALDLGSEVGDVSATTNRIALKTEIRVPDTKGRVPHGFWVSIIHGSQKIWWLSANLGSHQMIEGHTENRWTSSGHYGTSHNPNVTSRWGKPVNLSHRNLTLANSISNVDGIWFLCCSPQGGTSHRASISLLQVLIPDLPGTIFK